MISYNNKSGDSIENAIIIYGATDENAGVKAEYEYLGKKFGQPQKNWKLNKQDTVEQDDKKFDQLDIILANGYKETIYFDITNFFGKN